MVGIDRLNVPALDTSPVVLAHHLCVPFSLGVLHYRMYIKLLADKHSGEINVCA